MNIKKIIKENWLSFTLISVLGVSFQLYQFHREDEQMRKTVLESYPEFIRFKDTRNMSYKPYSLSSDEKASLEAILKNNAPPPEVAEVNVCKFYDLLENTGGNCTFLSKDWVLLSYHQIRQGFLQEILTSKGDSVRPGDFELVAGSPREDLALLKVNNSFDYIKTVTISPNLPKEQKGLVYVGLETDKKSKGKLKVRKQEIPSAVLSNDVSLNKNGIHNYNFVRFEDEANPPKFKVISGYSGGPIYQGTYLRGILVLGSQDGRRGYYSPRIREFLEKCLKEL